MRVCAYTCICTPVHAELAKDCEDRTLRVSALATQSACNRDSIVGNCNPCAVSQPSHGQLTLLLVHIKIADNRADDWPSTLHTQSYFST